MGFMFTFGKKSKEIKKIIESISAIIDETFLEFSSDGFKIIAMDKSHICLIALEIKKEDIEVLKIDENEKIGLNLKDLNKIIGRCKDSEIISFYNDKDENLFNIKFSSEKKKKDRVFKLRPIDLEEENLSLDSLFDIEFDTYFTIESKEFNEIIKDALILADYLNIKKEDNSINFNCMGIIGDMENIWEMEDFYESSFTNETPLNNTYGLKYLMDIIKSASFINKFKIKTGQDKPIVFKSVLFDQSSLLYFLAPRTEDEEEEDEEEEEY